MTFKYMMKLYYYSLKTKESLNQFEKNYCIYL